ncbi:hypothetical protein Tco_0495733 [Tanacetum coccineum]
MKNGASSPLLKIRDQVSILAKDKGFGHEMHKSEESEAVYGVTPSKDYTVTYSKEEMSYHTLYGLKPLLLYAATFKFTIDNLAESALRRNIGDKVTPSCDRGGMWDCRENVIVSLVVKWLGRAKCDLLLNNICDVFNRQLVDGRDQPIIICLEYIREYLMKRIVVVQKVIAKTVGPLTPSTTSFFDAIKKRPVSTLFNGIEATKKRKKSHEGIASESCSSDKLSRKGKSVKCGKYGNVGHNRKDCRGQGGATQAGGSRARNVSGQAGARNVSCQAAGARNVSSQSGGFSQPSTAQTTSTGARNASSQAAGASQPSAAPSTASQGLTQYSAGPVRYK